MVVRVYTPQHTRATFSRVRGHRFARFGTPFWEVLRRALLFSGALL